MIRAFWAAGRAFVACWKLRHVEDIDICVIYSGDDRSSSIDREWRELVAMARDERHDA